MIFKRWFKPKWQHENAAIRQLAIAELDDKTPAQKEILHELAFNDGAEAVRRTALERLNEFSLWWQASKHEPAERLKHFAEQQLVQMLLDNKVSAHLKAQFISECNRSSILEKLAQTEQDAELKFSLLQRLARQDLFQQAVLDEKLSIEQRKQLLNQLDDDKTLEKLSRVLTGELRETADALLAVHLEQKQKPERIRKQVVLLLAKLNSVREKTDFAELQQRYAAYQQEWQQLSPELVCLTDAAEFIEKYHKVVELTERSIAPKIAEFAKMQQQQVLAKAAEQRFNALSVQLENLQQQLAVALNEAELTKAAGYQQSLDDVRAEVAVAQLPTAFNLQLQQQMTQISQQLDKLPELAEALAQSARLLAEAAAHTLPQANDDVAAAYQLFKNWQQQWQRQSKVLKQLMPESFSSSYQQLVQQWREHCEPLLAQQDKVQRLLKSKMAEFKRLHQAGKFNVLFGLFKGITADYLQLNAAQQQSLQKEYQLLEAQVQDLAELQAYIATPRKQQLVESMQQLAVATDLTPTERAAAVKNARAQWNTLGRADADVEAALNDAFNSACELAFAPCRDYFAKLDAERAQSALRKQQLIEQMQASIDAGVSGKTLDALITQYSKDWQQSGSVEKDVYANLQPQYQQLLNNLKQQQKAQQQQNVELKTALVQAAKTVSQSQNEQAGNELKTLQQQWKLLGYAGKAVDQQLWLEFRAACDSWFESRAAHKQALQQQQEAERLAQTDVLATLTQSVNEAQDEKALLQQLQQLAQFKPVDEQQAVSQKALKQRVEQNLAALQQNAELDSYRQLFSALEQPQPNLSDLPPIYRLVFNQQQEKTLSRADLTLALEWLAKLESPAAEQSRRQQVQMQLLTDKHNSGEAVTQPQLLS
ncbi:DUF349 domain-containing protein, partial [Rheinheimera sp.]|uniref:DUF349 domain-containing protein n=1 Tax=Rheinheimera sp. TaxID=1869214 RepID=UPI0027BAD34B